MNSPLSIFCRWPQRGQAGCLNGVKQTTRRRRRIRWTALERRAAEIVRLERTWSLRQKSLVGKFARLPAPQNSFRERGGDLKIVHFVNLRLAPGSGVWNWLERVG